MRTWSLGTTAAALGVAALLGSVGCNSTSDLATLRAQGNGSAQAQPASGYSGAPVLQGASAAQTAQNGQVIVTCEPHQRTLVRPVMLNGQSLSQVECVSTGAPVGYDQGQMLQYAPAQAAPAYYAPAAPRPVRTVSYAPAPRRTYARRSNVSYAPETVRRGRSVKKSLIIIGSSAGIGAGVGAATGGKKGALIGAAIGGGGAAIWDQVTRNKDRN